MNITAYDYGRFVEIVYDPDGSGQYAEGVEIEIPEGSTVEEVIETEGFRLAEEWEEFEWFGRHQKAAGLIQL